MDIRQIALLRPEEILAEMARCPAAYLPIGLIEWHGPHLPMGLDALNAENAARLAAEQTGGLLLPTLYCGTERERPPQMLEWLGFERDEWIVGMDFPANSLPSMYVSEEILALMVRENLRMALGFGFRLVVIVTGHAAENQIAVLERLAAEFNAAGVKSSIPFKVLVVLPFVRNEQGVLEVGHASRIETAVMQALAPERVKLDNLPPLPQPLNNTDWAIIDYATFMGSPTPERTVPNYDDPRRATPADGQTTIDRATAQIAGQVRAALEELYLSKPGANT